MRSLSPWWFALALGAPLVGGIVAPNGARAATIIDTLGNPMAPYSNGYFTATAKNPSVSVPLTLIGSSLLGLDPYYELSVSVSDLTPADITADATLGFGATLNGTPLTLSATGTGTFSGTVELSNGPNPPAATLVLTNEFQLDNPKETTVPTDAFALLVTEIATPEPASIGLLGAGLGLLGLWRRRRARG